MDSQISSILTLPQGRSISTDVWRLQTAFPLWFNRDQPIAPDTLLPYTEGRKYLSTKQVPSALLLSRVGSLSVTKNRTDLLKYGFRLREQTRKGKGVDPSPAERIIGAERPQLSASLASFLSDSQRSMDILHQDSMDIDEDNERSGSENSNESDVLEEDDGNATIRFRKNCRYRLAYDDPWKIHAACVLAKSQDRSGPDVVVWSGDGIRLQDQLPVRILGPDWDGSRKHTIRFHEIADTGVKRYVLYQHTFWGRQLSRLCDPSLTEDINEWARLLRYRINRYLDGGADPLLSKRQRNALLLKPNAVRSKRARALRLIEMLKTVDGVFIQRYVAYPEEVWTWERFDMFTLGNISMLIGDEFLDGEVTKDALTIATSYSLLKSARKWFKEASHRNLLEHGTQGLPEGNPWARQFVNVWKNVTNRDSPRSLFLKAVLSQTRGAGTPPPLVLLQSKVKFLETISLKSPPQSDTMISLRRMGLNEVLTKLPDESFTGLATKSRVTVTSSACWEKTRREGGTIEQVREILASMPSDEQIPIRNLDTGQVETHRFASDFNSVGELIFWSCLDHVLRTPPDDLKVAFLTVVKEPGKARSVTKARACLKIVLDTVSKICSEPLAKGIRSSASGMSAANHGWNFFLELMTTEMKSEIFYLSQREENPYEGYVEKHDSFDDLFILSTDYKEATDQMPLQVASDLGNAWMRKCGIPALLRGIVNETCYKPRTVLFRATGPLRTMGKPAPEFGPDIRKLTLRKGVLMGDPLTKPVLHLTNVLSRYVGSRILDPSFYVQVPRGASARDLVRRASRALTIA